MNIKEQAYEHIEVSWAEQLKLPGYQATLWIHEQFPAEDTRPVLVKALDLLGLAERYERDGRPAFAAFRRWWKTNRCRPTIKGCMHSAEHAPALEYADGRIHTFSPTSHSEERALEIAKDIYQRQQAS